MARQKASQAVKAGTIDVGPKPGYLETPAMHPETGTSKTALISRSKVNGFLRYGPAHKFYEAMGPVRETLFDPEFILPYAEDEWRGFCYSKRVKEVPNNDGRMRAMEDGYTFVVFVADTMKVVEWGIEACGRWDEAGLPLNRREGKMGDVLWPK